MRLTLDLETRASRNVDETLRVLELLLEAMVLVSVPQYATRADGGLALPRLGYWTAGGYVFDTTIRYEREPRGAGWVRENWQDAARTVELRKGDCEDLAVQLSAELQALDGIEAWPRMRAFPPRPGRTHWLFHVDVGLPDGSAIDPSAALGMLETPRRWPSPG